MASASEAFLHGNSLPWRAIGAFEQIDRTLKSFRYRLYNILYIIELMNANPDSFKTIRSPSRSCTAQIVFMNFYNVSARLQGFAFLDFYQENNPPPRQGLCNLWSSADLAVLLYCYSINNWQKEVMGYTQGCLGYVRPQQATFSKVRESSYTTSHLQYLRQTSTVRPSWPSSVNYCALDHLTLWWTICHSYISCTSIIVQYILVMVMVI